jgi:hypothetical protein
VKPISAPHALSTRTGFWFATIAMIGAVACILALGIAALGAIAGTAVAVTAPGPPDSQVSSEKYYEGIITDTRCGAKHSAAIGKTAADCTLACIHSGEHFALVDGETVYSLDGDLAALKRVAGQRVKVAGSLNGNKLSVTSIAALP